jgi:hypothetical protein
MNDFNKPKIMAPVLFISFARLEYARPTFDAIKLVKPAKLYFYSNKARPDRPDELLQNDNIRDFTKEINWECDLHTFFRDEYVDIYTSLWSAIDWIFKYEESAIILEEDCVASMAFFDFCEQLLPIFKEDQRIWVISGNNFIENYNPNSYDYFFSYFPFLYGWASWRNRWQKVIRDRLPIEKIKEYQLYNQIYVRSKAARKALKFTEKIVNTQAWDYRFTISMKCQGGFGILPKVNLVSNIGLLGEHNKGEENTFYKRNLPIFSKYEINNPPPFIVPDYGYSEHWYNSYYLKKSSLPYKMKCRLLHLFRKISMIGFEL